MKHVDSGFLFAIGAAVTWGLTYTIDQKILANVAPTTLLLINSVLASIVVLPFVYFNRKADVQTLSLDKQTWALIIVSVLLGTLASFFILASIRNLNASTASIIEIAYPFFVVLFSSILFRSTPNIYFFLGGALIFAGTTIIVKFA